MAAPFRHGTRRLISEDLDIVRAVDIAGALERVFPGSRLGDHNVVRAVNVVESGALDVEVAAEDGRVAHLLEVVVEVRNADVGVAVGDVDGVVGVEEDATVVVAGVQGARKAPLAGRV